MPSFSEAAKNDLPGQKLSDEAVVDHSGQVTQMMVTGLSWSLGAQLLKQVSQFLITVFLARLLAPQEFGLLGMVFVFSGFATLFNDLGFGPALVQRTKIEERHFCSVFWLNVVFGIALAGILIAAAPLIADFYREPRLIPIVMLVGLCFPITALGLVQKARLTRQMDFRALGLIDVGSISISGIIAILLAWRGFGVWSLVWQVLCLAICEVVGLWWFSAWRPRLFFNRTAILELFGFSSNLTGFTVINYWIRNGDNLLVGKFFGSAALGIYARAYDLMLMPLNQITFVVSKVMFPALSRLQEDKVRVRNIYLRATAVIALITFPLMLGLLVVSDHFILAFYGPVWSEVIPILRIFCVLGLIQSVGSMVGCIYQSQGRTDWMFRWGLAAGGVWMGAIILGIWLGTLEALAVCLVLIGSILTPVSLSIPGRLIDMTFLQVARSVSGVLACALAMAGSVWVLGTMLPSSWSHWMYLAAQVPFGIGVYALLVHFSRLVSYQELRSLVMRQVQAAVA